MNEKQKLRKILSKIKKDYMGNNWKSNRSVLKFIRFVNGISLHYSYKLGYTQLEILESLEKRRNYWSANYYQKSSFPRLNKNVDIIKNSEEFKKRFPSGIYICPACGGKSSDYQNCNSWKPRGKHDTRPCNWKAYGFFGTLGKGYSFVLKDNFLNLPIVFDIFKPIELCKK